MSAITHISDETMKYKSVVATHDALIELGRLDENEKNNEKQQIIDNEKVIIFLKKNLAVIEYFEKSEKQSKNKMIFENPDTFKEIINKSLNHIDKLNNLIEKNKLKCNKLENENNELEKETRELIDQTEELENDIENNKEKNIIRIEKLRDMCKKRNKTIKIQKKLLIIIIVHSLIISYIGFAQYYYTLLNQMHEPNNQCV